MPNSRPGTIRSSGLGRGGGGGKSPPEGRQIRAETIVTNSFQFSLAPEKLWQAINPRSFYNQGAQLGFVNINLGRTNHPEIEQKVLDEVGSYGRQLGRIGD